MNNIDSCEAKWAVPGLIIPPGRIGTNPPFTFNPPGQCDILASVRMVRVMRRPGLRATGYP